MVRRLRAGVDVDLRGFAHLDADRHGFRETPVCAHGDRVLAGIDRQRYAQTRRTELDLVTVDLGPEVETRGQRDLQSRQLLLELLDAAPREDDPIVFCWQRIDGLFPVLPSAGELAELLLAGREVHQRPRRRVELLTLGEFRA